MRQGCLFLLFLLVCPSYARVNVAVAKFEDKSGASRCPASVLAKETADLQAKLIEVMMGFDRYEIQERQVRPLKVQHQFKGTLRTLEICPLAGRVGQTAEVVLEVQVLDGRGSLTHTFTSTAKATSSATAGAGETALNAAVTDISRRIDGAIPGKRSVRLQVKRQGGSVAENEYKVRLIRRPSSVSRQR